MRCGKSFREIPDAVGRPVALGGDHRARVLQHHRFGPSGVEELLDLPGRAVAHPARWQELRIVSGDFGKLRGDAVSILRNQRPRLARARLSIIIKNRILVVMCPRMCGHPVPAIRGHPVPVYGGHPCPLCTGTGGARWWAPPLLNLFLDF